MSDPFTITPEEQDEILQAYEEEIETDEERALRLAYEMFPGVTLAEALERGKNEDDWVVPGLISATTTLLYGEAKIGKSWMVSALVGSLLTGSEFLGVKPEDRPYSVGVFATDDRGESEYSGRIGTICPDDDDERLRLYQMPPMTPEGWESLATVVRSHGHNVVIIDNLSQALQPGGSINDDPTVRAFFDGVRKLIRSGVAVVIVGHTSDKAGMNGYKPTTPLGSSVISQMVRWKLFIWKTKNKNLGVKSSGNLGYKSEGVVRSEAGARFTVLSWRTEDDRELAEQKRSKETLDRNAEIASWVVENCQGMSRNKSAETVAAHFDGTEGRPSVAVSSFKSQVSKGYAYGAMLDRPDDGSWSLKTS
ncbi:AAA family ATPase [Gordonia sp. HY285]|uniref:AAA family ATPase n=1 Tax=Gordonia liuliyuniae TaxID=2911517 RepID=UPI001F230156|nr:AAA family ATPase [Gordonia liuliyuniae]MCF8611718.1 AAA family ATPase [Gordonia liuliyuniae]